AAGPSASIYEVATGRLQAELPVETGRDAVLTWHPSGKYLAVAGLQQIQLWEVDTAARVSTMDGHSSLVTTLSFHPSGSWLISDNWDGTPRLWQLAPGREWLRFFSGLNFLRFSN